jgi:hypothetical protein
VDVDVVVDVDGISKGEQEVFESAQATGLVLAVRGAPTFWRLTVRLVHDHDHVYVYVPAIDDEPLGRG